MSLKEEVDWIKHKLNAARMQGEIDYTGDIDVHEKNGNTYIEVECTDPNRTRTIREFLEGLDTDYFSEAKMRNTADGRYVYTVAHNQTI